MIQTTSDHPFFIGGRWLQVQQLHTGDSLASYTGKKFPIDAITRLVKPTTVHNFEVADFHTYYVSAQQVLVHNNVPCPNGTGAAKGGFNAASKSLPELQAIAKQNSSLFRQLFGTNEKGAQAVLDNIKNVKIPEGLSKEAMQAYRELINKVGDPRGTQAIRAKILDELLKR